MEVESRTRLLLPSSINPKDKECDFYRNPTILSRLINNFKYKAATQRLEKRGNAEACVWVCTKRKNNPVQDVIAAQSTAASSLTSSIISHAKEGYGYRQLPIHMAVDALFRVADHCLRADLESLIAHLVIANPGGCSKRDHEGKLPLLEAIWHNASPETVSALLMAYPEGAQEKDSKGRYPHQINEHRNGPYKDQVSKLLRLKKEFWAAAGREAHLRLKHRNVPSAEASVASMSVLASSVKNDDDTLVSSDSFDFSVDPTHPKAAGKFAGHVKALRWSQIEQRAMTLESKLAESYEQNYKLKNELTELVLSKKIMQKKMDKLLKTDRAMEIAELVMAQEEAEVKLRVLKARLADNDLPVDYPSQDHPETLHLPASYVSVERDRNAQLVRELDATRAEFAAYRQEKEKEMWELEKKMQRETTHKDERIKALEQQLAETSTPDTLRTIPTDKTVSEFTKSFGSDDETLSTEGSSATPSRPEHDEGDDELDVDAVLQNAIRLNGGQSLSPRLVEMWNMVRMHTPSLDRVVEDGEDGFDRRDDIGSGTVEEGRRKGSTRRSASHTSFSTKSTEFHSCRSRMSGDRSSRSDKTGLMVPALDHQEHKAQVIGMRTPAGGGFNQDVSDLTLSVSGAPSWTHSSKGRRGAPRNLSKEVSEMTMSLCGDGCDGPMGKGQSSLQEISEISLSVWNEL